MAGKPNDAAMTPDYPARPLAWWVVAALMIVTLISFLDRSLPTLLFDPLRAEFGITDTQVSLLQGYAFFLIYIVMGLPFGRLVDHANRRNLILVGLLLWSGLTIVSGLVTEFWQLVIARMGIGVGEAVLAPAAYSIIADYFPPKAHGRALGIYFVATYLGGGGSLVLGGLILQQAHGWAGLPLIGSLEPWRMVFVLAGLPGIAAAALMFTVREPSRRGNAVSAAVPGGASFVEFLAHIGAHPRTFVAVFTCYAAMGFIGAAMITWAPSFYLREFGIATSQTGLLIGSAVGVTGLAGCLISGYLSDRWHERAAPGGRFRVSALAVAILLPAALIWPLVSNHLLSVIVFAAGMFGMALGTGAAPATIQQVVPNRMRGKAIAVYVLVGGLLGAGLAPTAIALVTEHVFHGAHSALKYSLFFTPMPAIAFCAIVCWIGLKAYPATLAALSSPNAAQRSS